MIRFEMGMDGVERRSRRRRVYKEGREGGIMEGRGEKGRWVQKICIERGKGIGIFCTVESRDSSKQQNPGSTPGLQYALGK